MLVTDDSVRAQRAGCTVTEPSESRALQGVNYVMYPRICAQLLRSPKVRHEELRLTRTPVRGVRPGREELAWRDWLGEDRCTQLVVKHAHFAHGAPLRTAHTDT